MERFLELRGILYPSAELVKMMEETNKESEHFLLVNESSFLND